ncbi:DUF3696 domain-containing protein [Vogesella indigofera]|uniref:DUF3696 domain-containing protein n=1 Tax=Vogesella indigofera TaxID=45465 RepID=UPI00234ED1F4|nr:DUF3696 domain-containing protein [Vogesella indigofera]MDC7699573.1 DUF3696 domain-containing protein [Vogesella indigofera]
MIDYFRVCNLKCFENQAFPVSSLTLLTGFNAAGKSTALHGLLLISQFVRQGTCFDRLPLNGELVRLGTPGDVLREGNTSSLMIEIEGHGAIVCWIFQAGESRTGHDLEVKYVITPDSRGAQVSELINVDGLNKFLPDLAPEGASLVIKTLAELVYISAVRSGADDVFPIPNSPDIVWADVGVRGEYAAWWFADCMDDDVEVDRRHPNELAPNLRRQFNAWAGELFPGVEANAQIIPGTGLVKLELRNNPTGAWRRPANIGYGLSYAFPILVAGLLAKKGQILVVDSPEAHLHPMAQSRIGYFLAVIAQAGVQVLIETHSDHVLNGIRLAVQRRKLSPRDAAIYFFNHAPVNDNDPAHVVSPVVYEDGKLSEWPNGFFDQAEKDLGELAGWS